MIPTVTVCTAIIPREKTTPGYLILTNILMKLLAEQLVMNANLIIIIMILSVIYYFSLLFVVLF